MANDGPAAMRSATLNPNQLAPPPQQGGSSNDARARSLTWDVGDGDGMEVPVARSETAPVMLSTDTAADAEQQVYMWAGNGYATKKREVPGSARSAYFSGYVEGIDSLCSPTVGEGKLFSSNISPPESSFKGTWQSPSLLFFLIKRLSTDL